MWGLYKFHNHYEYNYDDNQLNNAEKYGKQPFSGWLRRDWENTARAAAAGLVKAWVSLVNIQVNICQCKVDNGTMGHWSNFYPCNIQPTQFIKSERFVFKVKITSNVIKTARESEEKCERHECESHERDPVRKTQKEQSLQRILTGNRHKITLRGNRRQEVGMWHTYIKGSPDHL